MAATVGIRFAGRWRDRLSPTVRQLGFGLEGQGDWADFQELTVSIIAAAATNQSKIEAIGLVTGQVGYAWNNVLWYRRRRCGHRQQI